MIANASIENHKKSHSGLTNALLSRSRFPLLISDFFLAIAAFYSAAWIGPHYLFGDMQFKLTFPAITFCFSFICLALGLGYYEKDVRFFPKRFLAMNLISGALAFIFTLIAVYFSYAWDVGRTTPVFGGATAILVLLIYRYLMTQVVIKMPMSFVILGDKSEITNELLKEFKNENQRRTYLFKKELSEKISNNIENSSEILKELMSEGVNDIILTSGTSSNEKIMSFAVNALNHGIRITDELSFFMEVFERLPKDSFSRLSFIFSELKLNKFFSQFFKRVGDIILSSFLIILTMPFMMAIAILIKLTSRGPILFIQKRQGYLCKPFLIYKFRTMAHNHSGPLSTLKKDPRITTAGHLLRKLHLDELPQLFNILKGEMSFVGPRPEAYDFAIDIKDKIPYYNFRHLVRPGLTGLSQMKVGYTFIDIDETKDKLAHDIYYIINFSISFDIILMLRTAFYLAKGSR